MEIADLLKILDSVKRIVTLLTLIEIFRHLPDCTSASVSSDCQQVACKVQPIVCQNTVWMTGQIKLLLSDIQVAGFLVTVKQLLNYNIKR